MSKVTIPYTCTINSKVYFPGEVELEDKEAETITAFLKTVPSDHPETEPVTDSPLAVTKDDSSDDKKKGRGTATEEA